MISFSADIDWATENLIEDTISIFEEFNVPCTFFATHKSEALKNCSQNLFEIGIHPNFNKLILSGTESADKILSDLLNLFPSAKGFRSHSLTRSSIIQQMAFEKGLIYEANTFLPYWTNIRPFKLWNGLICIPHNWEDDVHFVYGKSFSEAGISIDKNSLLVLDFHPIHIFLNTENPERYTAAKKYYQDHKQLKNYINKSNVPGVRDFLIMILKLVKEKKLDAVKMIQLANSTPDNI